MLCFKGVYLVYSLLKSTNQILMVIEEICNSPMFSVSKIVLYSVSAEKIISDAFSYSENV